MELPLSYFLKRPKYWLGLSFFGVLWLVSRLPLFIQIRLANGLGWLLLRLAKRRRKIAEINLALCFPTKTAQQRQALLIENFRQTALGLIEIAASWFTDLRSRREHSRIIGSEHLEQAQAKGNGVILLVFHLTSMELGGSLLAQHFDYTVLYKPNRNRLMEWLTRTGRLRHVRSLIRQNDVRATIKALKQNKIVWYSTDQNYGSKSGTFVPFFNTQAWTITAISKFARLTGASIVPFTHKRINNYRGLELQLHPELKNFPGQDAEEDAARINQFLEDYLTENPENYLWLHQRFRDRPPGEPPIYP